MKNKVCKKCGSKLKTIKTGIRVPAEPHRPDDVYDGTYKGVEFVFCEKCDTKK
jgi:hypothetical protein